MDVTCPRCQTDYEFDDALVSERGTTVKCTNCGHQFRVFRPRSSLPGAAATAPELWRIERREGEPLELRSLVELQRAIRAGRVSRNDLLRKGDGAPRRVSDIPELEPFFPAQRVDSPQNTLPLPAASHHPVQVTRIPAHTPAYGKAPAPAAPATPPARSGSGTLRPPGAVPPPQQGNAPPNTSSLVTGVVFTPPTTEESSPGAPKRSNRPPPPPGVIHTPLGLSPYSPSEASPAGGAPLATARLQTPAPRLQTPLPPPRTPPPHRQATSERASLEELAAQLPAARDEAEPPTEKRIEHARFQRGPTMPQREPELASEPPPAAASRQELYDSLFPVSKPRRGGGAKWLVALLLVAGVGVLGATVGRPYLTRFFAGEPQGAASTSTSTSAGKLQDAMAAGDRARADGDFRVASDAYQRATEADDKSLAAWDGLCAAQSEYALLIWLDALGNGSSVEHQQAASIGNSAGQSCGRWGELARATPEGAKKVNDDLRPARALAAQGSTAALRYFLPTHANDPVLQALVQLADATNGVDAAAVATAAKAAAPALDKVVDLSTLATPGDVAVVAFVAALAGPPSRLDAALAELARRAPKHMLLDTLRQLGARGDAGPAGPDTGGKDAGAADAKIASTATISTAAGASTGGGLDATDYRELDRKAYDALNSGDVGKAETMFRAAQAQNPNDIDSMFGLAQIERSRGNHAGAIEGFKQVLSRSPGYGPARIGLADEQWGSAQGEAIANYKLYLQGNGSGPNAERARTRIASVEGATTTTAPTDTAAPTTTTSATSPAPAGTP